MPIAKSLPTDQILVGDCAEIMAELPEHSIDLVFADPPYNLQLRGELLRPDNSHVKSVNDEWDQIGDFAAYDKFTKQWLTSARRVLKPNGGLWVIGSYHNIFRIGAILQDLGFWLLNDIIWIKSNPMPNFRGRRFTNAHETLIWAALSPKARPCFNYEAMKNLNEDKQMRSDWYFPLCGGSERLRDESGGRIHSTQKPEALLYRLINASTNAGDVILDPFFGTGTTGAVAKALDRRFIGIERDPAYVAHAQNRIDGVNPPSTMGLPSGYSPLHTPARRTEPRVAFGSLVECGWLAAGQVLSDKSGRHRALVNADGTLTVHDDIATRGSIHHIGAVMQGQETCNGWTFWYYQDETGKAVSINLLRQRFRRENGE